MYKQFRQWDILHGSQYQPFLQPLLNIQFIEVGLSFNSNLIIWLANNCNIIKSDLDFLGIFLIQN